MSQVRLRKRLGDLLVDEKVISQVQLDNALEAQHSSGRKLGETLIRLGFLTEQKMLSFLSQQLSLPLIDLSRAQIDGEAVQLLPEVHQLHGLPNTPVMTK